MLRPTAASRGLPRQPFASVDDRQQIADTSDSNGKMPQNAAKLVETVEGKRMRLAESILNENLVYSSPRIYERRRRILKTARDLIARHGYDGFSIRELCQQAKVAPHTVYKAFESKERLVALSIREHFLSFIETRAFIYDKATLEGVIERLIVSDLHMHDSREFVIAIVALYFSQTAAEDLQVAARMNILVTLHPWAVELRERGHLRVGLGVEPFVHALVGGLFHVSLDWCRGVITNEEFLCEKLQALLIYASGATRGPGRKEVDLYLADLLGRRELISKIQASVVAADRAVDAKLGGPDASLA